MSFASVIYNVPVLFIIYVYMYICIYVYEYNITLCFIDIILKIISMESELMLTVAHWHTHVFNPSVLINIKTPAYPARSRARIIQAGRSTLAQVRTHVYARTSSRCSRAIRRDVPGRSGRDGTERDGECETRLCGQAERVLDCGSPLCPTHPPTAPRRNASLAPAGSACSGLQAAGSRKGGREKGPRKGPRMKEQANKYRVASAGTAGERGAPSSDP